MDTTWLGVGQDVYMRSGGIGDWAKVVKVTRTWWGRRTGVIVESDPAYKSELIRFDRDGVACDSSDLCNDRGVRGGSAIPIGGSGPWGMYKDYKDAGFYIW